MVFGRRMIAMLVGEFLGTGILTMLVLSVKTSNIAIPFFVAVVAGLTLSLLVFVLGNLSSGNYNPAVTLALGLARRITPVMTILFILVQFAAAWCAYELFKYFVNVAIPASHAHFTWRTFTEEAVGTGVFAFGLAAAMYQGFTRAVNASVSGLAYLVGILAVSQLSIELLNPALAFGTRNWVLGSTILAPVLGAVVGVFIYALLFAAETETVAAVVTPGASASTATRRTSTRTAAKKSTAANKRRTSTRARR